MKNAGCNKGLVGPSGKNSTRMNPSSFARNNLSKGGVNKDPLVNGDGGMKTLPSNAHKATQK
jgi:hypothetical protein